MDEVKKRSRKPKSDRFVVIKIRRDPFRVALAKRLMTITSFAEELGVSRMCLYGASNPNLPRFGVSADLARHIIEKLGGYKYADLFEVSSRA